MIDVLVVPADVRLPLRLEHRHPDALPPPRAAAGGLLDAVTLFGPAAFLHVGESAQPRAGRPPNPRASLIAAAHNPQHRPCPTFGDALLVGPPRRLQHTHVPAAYTTALLATSARYQVEFHRPGSSYRWRWTSAAFPEAFTAYRAGLHVVQHYPSIIVRAVPSGPSSRCPR